jgi:hypothetical protein
MNTGSTLLTTGRLGPISRPSMLYRSALSIPACASGAMIA